MDNGLRVNLLPDSSLPLVAVNLWYHVGSRHESPGRTGLAHLFEHMLFEGSAHVPGNDHFRLIQQVGGSANGSTWYDRTNYYETVPAHCLELALWLEADRMGFLLPALTPEKLAIQQQVVLNERRERIDNQPYGLALERLFAGLYPDSHPYGWPVIGTPEDIAAATLDDVRKFFQTWYTPDNAVLTLVGDFGADAALSLVERWFADIPSRDTPHTNTNRPPDAPIRLNGPMDEVMGDRVELERCYIGFRLPPYGTPDWYAADLLAAVLATGKASRLYKDLVHDRKMAHQVSASTLPTELGGSFLVVATASDDDGASALVERVQAHLGDVARGEVSAAAVERARSQVLSGYVESLQTLEERADEISQFTTFLDRPDALHDEFTTYSRIQPEDLVRVAQRWLAPADAVILRVVPEERL
ncbi:MAG: M16 family metallopeptidase [Thermoanaerobaculia bacterium]